ncbi:hypothetical protein [Phyllobacterium sp. SB3]|uniref:hypothetical protein n=1 Tax=Phyllobacterium sp. SB3 TaxID=3156073 RepID=UPI0032AEA081
MNKRLARTAANVQAIPIRATTIDIVAVSSGQSKIETAKPAIKSLIAELISGTNSWREMPVHATSSMPDKEGK